MRNIVSGIIALIISISWHVHWHRVNRRDCVNTQDIDGYLQFQGCYYMIVQFSSVHAQEYSLHEPINEILCYSRGMSTDNLVTVIDHMTLVTVPTSCASRRVTLWKHFVEWIRCSQKRRNNLTRCYLSRHYCALYPCPRPTQELVVSHIRILP